MVSPNKENFLGPTMVNYMVGLGRHSHLTRTPLSSDQDAAIPGIRSAPVPIVGAFPAP